MTPTHRKRQLLDAALYLAQQPQTNYLTVTREAIAAHAGVSIALVSYHLGTVKAMRRSIMRHAVAVKCARVVAQGVASRDRHATE